MLRGPVLTRYGKVNRSPGGIFGLFTGLMALVLALFPAQMDVRRRRVTKRRRRVVGRGRAGGRAVRGIPQAGGAPGRMVEFASAAIRHTEGPFMDVLAAPFANSLPLAPADIPAFGYLRFVTIIVTVSVAGGLGTGTLAEDFPFNLIDSIAIRDTNGDTIYGPTTGHNLFLANLFGGYVFRSDPRQHPDFLAGYTTVNFMLRIPVEITGHDGLGALPNQHSSVQYRLEMTLAPAATFLSAVGTATANTYRVRAFLEAWTLPDRTDIAGRPQQRTPPYLGIGQSWSAYTVDVAAGERTIQLVQVGNLIRQIVAVFRTPQGQAPVSTRSTANFPDPVELRWDSRQVDRKPRQMLRAEMWERQVVPVDLPAGVFAWQNNDDVLGHAGGETGERWYETTSASRIELNGIFGTAGSLTLLINEVSPAEITPQERYVFQAEAGPQAFQGYAPVGA